MSQMRISNLNIEFLLRMSKFEFGRRNLRAYFIILITFEVINVLNMNIYRRKFVLKVTNKKYLCAVKHI